MGVNFFNPFSKARDRYGIEPKTVWNIDNSDPLKQELKRLIGDGATLRAGSGKQNYREGIARANCFKNNPGLGDRGLDVYQVTESIFNPLIVDAILKMNVPPITAKQTIRDPAKWLQRFTIFDPFAGGGTRAIMSFMHGVSYTGIELRKAEVDAVIERCRNNNVNTSDPRAKPYCRIICGDSTEATKFVEPRSADLLLTCPPYWNLETYDGGERDLSMVSTYKGFLDALEKVLTESYKILRPGSLSCWIIGLHRRAGGELLPMHHDLTRLHLRSGFRLKEEIILNHVNTGATQRLGQFDKGNQFMIRTHEYLMIYVRE